MVRQNQAIFDSQKIEENLVTALEDENPDCLPPNSEFEQPKASSGSKESKVKKKKSTNPKKVSVSSKIEKLQKREEEDQLISKYISFCCNLCTEAPFSNIESYKMHRKSAHSEAYPVIVCCNRRLYNRVRILNHISYHHEMTTAFKCPHCAKSFKRQSFLSLHLKCHGLQEVHKVRCDQCSEQFLYKSQLLKHRVDQHMSPEEAETVQLSKCAECGKTFATKAHMQAHVRRIHRKQERLICHVCAKIFTKKERLTAHLLYLHTENPPKHKCELCHEESATLEAYKRHLKWYHAKEKQYTCDICGVSRINEISLKQHKRFTHEMERKFTCNFCPKAFKRQIELTEHLTIHLGGSLYNCPYCGRNFNSKSNMQTHAKRRCTAAPRTDFNAHLAAT